MERLELTVAAEDIGERIDKYLSEQIEGLSRSAAEKLISDGRVTVGDKAVKKNYRTAGGDIIAVVIDEPQPVDIEPEDIPLDIVYEDADLLVVNKPKGMVVHPAVGHYSGTLVNALMYHCRDDLSGINGELRPGIVHRIDKNTSGLLVVAKTAAAKAHLGMQFFKKTTKRTYNAVVWGNLKEDNGTVVGNITRNPRNRLQMCVSSDDSIGKHAVTHYRVLERLSYVSLVECNLETGRTHQIRVHMKHIGHILFNDDVYGGDEILKGTNFSKYSQFVRNCFKLCPRQALHAKTLGFIHPVTGEMMHFDSELPEDFLSMVDAWRRYASASAGFLNE